MNSYASMKIAQTTTIIQKKNKFSKQNLIVNNRQNAKNAK
jgi:hypothetical protein